MIDDLVVDLSRLQFAITALYHFLFVPLTMGLSLMLGIMETVYVMTGRRIWRDMVRFWGILFGINFAMGVATGITMEFQFGTNWAYFSHYVGDVFGVPLAIEGLMAFFMEATFVGLFFFGWDRLSRRAHLICTWLMALGTNFSALWILVANGWMQNPVGATLNPDTMRMEITSFFDVLFNEVAQAKFVHTVSAGYVTGAMFVLSISAYYLLNGRNIEFAKRSLNVAVSFGLASALSVVVLGDESGYSASEHQKMKIAAIEAEWQTHEPPAGFNLFAIPNVEERRNEYEIKIPWVMGLIVTRDVDEEVPGILDLVESAKLRIGDGLLAHAALQRARQEPGDEVAARDTGEHQRSLGYALLLKRYRDDIENATADEIEAAAWDTVPDIPVLYWSFRIMVACGMFFILLFGYGFYLTSKRVHTTMTDANWEQHILRIKHRKFLVIAMYSLPLPWVAAEMGWIVAEYGRQPWVIEGIMPTFLGVSSVSAEQVWFSITGFILFYSALAIVDLFLLTKYIRKGPDGAMGLDERTQAAHARAPRRAEVGSSAV